MEDSRQHEPVTVVELNDVLGSERRVVFRCNICGLICSSQLEELDREKPSCGHCGSSVRFRGIVHSLSTALFGRSYVLSEFPYRPDVIGIGMSDPSEMATRLSQRLGYVNTFLHRDPVVDIGNINPAREGTLDFIISSEVLEHVAPPVDRAFENAFRLLKKGGVLVLTVPYVPSSAIKETVEHFPDLHEYSIQRRREDGQLILKNRTRDGRVQFFENLIFHGGDGQVLELRQFSEGDLLTQIKRAGFRDASILSRPYLAYGICWSQPWGLPIVAIA